VRVGQQSDVGERSAGADTGRVGRRAARRDGAREGEEPLDAVIRNLVALVDEIEELTDDGQPRSVVTTRRLPQGAQDRPPNMRREDIRLIRRVDGRRGGSEISAGGEPAQERRRHHGVVHPRRKSLVGHRPTIAGEPLLPQQDPGPRQLVRSETTHPTRHTLGTDPRATPGANLT